MDVIGWESMSILSTAIVDFCFFILVGLFKGKMRAGCSVFQICMTLFGMSDIGLWNYFCVFCVLVFIFSPLPSGHAVIGSIILT